jgi:signal transduction histidine kinase
MEGTRQKQEVANEKELASRERQQLVALIGNVAHDLKTPLHSFKMEIESLRVALVDVLAHFQSPAPATITTLAIAIPAAAASPATATALVTLGSGSGKVATIPPLPTTIESLLKSLSASSEFMMMAINRGIEFAKASGGIRCGRSALPLSLSIIITYHSYHLTPRLCSLQ